VALNMIASLDGRITVAGHATGLANRADYELFHAMRGAADAVLVGAGTVRAESYGPMEQLAVIVSNSLDLAPDLGVLRAPGNRVVVVTGSSGELAPCAAPVDYLRTTVEEEVFARRASSSAVWKATSSRWSTMYCATSFWERENSSKRAWMYAERV
jgi:riboflavin biosynthesis pyrimidine reductase